MIRHFAGVAEIVEDFEAAVQFYRDTLGLEVESLSEGYATATIPGVLHFGIWSRAEAAEATYGSPDAADRVPLGFTIAFEVDNVTEAAQHLDNAAVEVVQPTKTEPWGQVTSRFMTPSGALCEIAETPWARRITQPMSAE
jgi:catechol 2,3-dioxygenase-like lactoylglutathione lyase family enzyme